MECNKKSYKESIQNGFKTDTILHESVKPGLSYIADSLESMYKHYWLSDGTLLGWYRDCGIIPYTQDGDIALPAEEYDNGIKEHFLGNPHVHIWQILGNVSDSMELRLGDHNYGFQFDLFLMYKNDTHMWHDTWGAPYKYRLIDALTLAC